MRILVTGGAGFIGSHTVDALLANGHQVVILDNLHPTVHPHGKPEGLNPKAEFIYGSVRNKPLLRQALKGVQAVYHFAAYQDYLPDFSTFFDVNAVSTALLYEIIAAEGWQDQIAKIVVAASQAVMGEGRYACHQCPAKGAIYPQIRPESQLQAGAWDHLCPDCQAPLAWCPSDERVVSPCNPYALSKSAQEQITIQLGRRCGIPSVVMRYSIVQGPRQSVYNAYSGAMRIFALSLLNRRPPLIFEDGCQVRDFVNIQDVVQANLEVLENSEADDQVFNVGGNVAWTINDFYATMQEITGIYLEPQRGGVYRFGDTRHIFSDTRRLQALGWSPRYRVEDSIAAYWEYLLTQSRHQEILDQAEATMRSMKVIRGGS